MVSAAAGQRGPGKLYRRSFRSPPRVLACQTERAPPSLERSQYVGQSAWVSLDVFVVELGNVGYVHAQHRLHHPPHLGSGSHTEKRHFCLSVSTPFPRLPHRKSAGREEASWEPSPALTNISSPKEFIQNLLSSFLLVLQTEWPVCRMFTLMYSH